MTTISELPAVWPEGEEACVFTRTPNGLKPDGKKATFIAVTNAERGRSHLLRGTIASYEWVVHRGYFHANR